MLWSPLRSNNSTVSSMREVRQFKAWVTVEAMSMPAKARNWTGGIDSPNRWIRLAFSFPLLLRPLQLLVVVYVLPYT